LIPRWTNLEFAGAKPILVAVKETANHAD